MLNIIFEVIGERQKSDKSDSRSKVSEFEVNINVLIYKFTYTASTTLNTRKDVLKNLFKCKINKEIPVVHGGFLRH